MDLIHGLRGKNLSISNFNKAWLPKAPQQEKTKQIGINLLKECFFLVQ